MNIKMYIYRYSYPVTRNPNVPDYVYIEKTVFQWLQIPQQGGHTGRKFSDPPVDQNPPGLYLSREGNSNYKKRS